MGSQNFGYGGNMLYGGAGSPYGYRGGYPTSYSNFRLYNSPVNTYPLGGIGTVGPYGGKLIFCPFDALLCMLIYLSFNIRCLWRI